MIWQQFHGYNTKGTGNKRNNKQIRLHEKFFNYASKDDINRVKRQPKEWEKIFANHISDKGLISGIDRELLKLNNKQKSNSKMGKGLE